MRVLVAFLAVVALILSAGPAFAWSGWQKDPDVVLDPGRITSVVTQLLAPDTTIGDADTTEAGVGTEPVGIDDSMTSPPADPADDDPGHKYFVDNTPFNGDCPATPYTTIQAGVNASGPGDTVKVCPGTYPEQVRITGHVHDKLKLESLKPLQAIIQWPAAESSPLALVDFNQADQVTLRGFVITGPFTFGACSPDRHEGILVENAFDEHIHHNQITMIRNSLVSLRGCQEGDAVAIGRRTTIAGAIGTEPGSARIDHNVIDNYQKNGVQAVNQGTTANVKHNVITGPSTTDQPLAAPNGIVVFRQAATTIDHNVISGNHFAGSPTVATSGGVLLLDTPPSGSTQVDHNRIFDNDYGIDTATTNSSIVHNDVFQHEFEGVVLEASGIVAQKNQVRNNSGSGISLLDADNNLVKSNDVDDNGTAGGDMTDGIRVDSSSTGNQILKNKMEDNTTHACHDDSTGTGTAGTDNTWQGNHGDTETPAGICDPK